MVTAGSYQKERFFNTSALLAELTNIFLQRAEMYVIGWRFRMILGTGIIRKRAASRRTPQE